MSGGGGAAESAEESGDAAAEIEMDSCCGGRPSRHHVDLEVVNGDSEEMMWPWHRAWKHDVFLTP